MSYVLGDSNILLRYSDPKHLQYQEAKEAIKEVGRRGDILCVVPQNLVEFRAVATRPLSVNGLGMSQSDVKTAIEQLRKLFFCLRKRPPYSRSGSGLLKLTVRKASRTTTPALSPR